MRKRVTLLMAIIMTIAMAVFAVACSDSGDKPTGSASASESANVDSGNSGTSDKTSESETETVSECEHTGGTATCIKKAVCEKCGEEYGDYAAHVYGDWQHDDEKHWKECTTVGCDAKSEEGKHEGGEATCAAKAVCGACGAKYGDLAAHSFNVWQHDDEKHWKKCDNCDATTDKTAHDYNVWDKTGTMYDYKACECGLVDELNVFGKRATLIDQKLLLTGSSFAINIDGVSEYVSVESVMLGDYDLGNDLSALAISDELKADTAIHGKQTIVVTVKDEVEENHEIKVPVTLITKEITNAADLKSIQPTAAQKGVHGYYVLTNNVSDNGLNGNAYSGDWEETTGFFGTLDGQGHTVSMAANGGNGLFGILRGATIKNLTIADNWRSAYQSYALLAKATFNSTLENVTFTLAGGNTNANVGNGYGWISYAEFSGNTLKNVTVNDSKGYGSLFGFKFYNNTFDNVTINGTYAEMGHTANVVDKDGNIVEVGKAVLYDEVPKAQKPEQIVLEKRQDFVLDGKTSTIDLGEYKNCEIVSITTSTGYELNSLSSATASGVFKSAKQAHGEQNLTVTVILDGKTVEIIVPVTVVTKTIKTMSELQDAVKHTNGADNLYGYYVLENDVSYKDEGYVVKAASGGWSGDKAFRGTLDGRGFTITMNSSAETYGIFGTMNGATIKDVTIKDLRNNAGYKPIIARNAYNTAFSGVTIEIAGGAKLSGENDNTPIIGNTMQGCSLNNVKIKSSVEIVNVFANQSGNKFTDVTIEANVTVGFSKGVEDYPEGVTLVNPNA